MSEYYGVSPSSDFFAHYGVKGMKWGVRKAVDKSTGYRKAQKQLYKSIKKEMKAARKENRAAGYHAISGAKSIGSKLSKDTIKRLENAANRYDDAERARQRFDERVSDEYARRSKNGGSFSKAEQKKNWSTMERLRSNADKASDNYNRERDDISDKLLGKYANKKVKLDSHNTNMKRSASYVLEAAMRSQMKPRSDGVGLNQKQKQLERALKNASVEAEKATSERNRHLTDITGKRYRAVQETSAKQQKAADAFFKSMSEKQRKRYHDRYLW